MGRGARSGLISSSRSGGPTGMSQEQREGKARAYRKKDRPRVLHAYNQLDMNGSGSLDLRPVKSESSHALCEMQIALPGLTYCCWYASGANARTHPSLQREVPP